MSNMAAWIIRMSAKKQVQKTLRMAENVRVAQESILLDFVHKNADTKFGKKYSFCNIKSVDDFRKAIPIQDYEAHRPYIERLIHGESAVLTAEEPFMFNVTSGTTSEAKLIPITATQDRFNSAIMLEWLGEVAQSNPDAFSGDFLSLVSPEREGFAGSIPYGSMSGRVYRSVPWILRRRYAVPYEVFEVSDYAARYFLILRFSLARNITMAATPNPSTFTHLANVLAVEGQALIRALHDGKLGLILCGELGVQLAKKADRNPERAKQLQLILDRKGLLEPTDLWPQLQQIGCWTGGSVGYQAAKIPSRFGDRVAIRDLGFMASEARMSLPRKDETSSGLLTASINFFEFIPEEENPTPYSPTLLAHELEIGRRYYVIITTASGLYRYDINDVIEVTGMSGTCPEIAFMRKGRDMANITGEKLYVGHVLETMRKVLASRASLRVKQFRVWPNIESSRYEFAIEFESYITLELLDSPNLLAELDACLQQMNVEYAAKRASGRLQGPVIHVMKQGWAEEAVACDFKSGLRDVQYKWCFLVQGASTDDLMSIMKTFGL